MRPGRILPAILLLGTLWLSSCKPNDAAIKAKIEEKINANPDAAGAVVDVKDGVATLSGQVKDDLSKDKVAGLLQDIKGIKSVVNNITIVPAPVVAPPTTPAAMVTADDALTKMVTDATKDFPTVTAAVKEGVISLTGDIKKTELPKLMMALSALHPKKIDNKLTVK